MWPKCPGHSLGPSSQVSQLYWRSIVPKRGSLMPLVRGRWRWSSYDAVSLTAIGLCFLGLPTRVSGYSIWTTLMRLISSGAKRPN